MTTSHVESDAEQNFDSLLNNFYIIDGSELLPMGIWIYLVHQYLLLYVAVCEVIYILTTTPYIYYYIGLGQYTTSPIRSKYNSALLHDLVYFIFHNALTLFSGSVRYQAGIISFETTLLKRTHT